MGSSLRLSRALSLLCALLGCSGDNHNSATNGSGGSSSASGGGSSSETGGGSTSGAHDVVTADAGPDRSVTAPAASVTLVGSGSSTSGSVKFLWTQTAGPVAAIAKPTAASTAVTDLVTGSYAFQLTVTDAHGHSAHDTAKVTVDPHGTSSSRRNATT